MSTIFILYFELILGLSANNGISVLKKFRDFARPGTGKGEIEMKCIECMIHVGIFLSFKATYSNVVVKSVTESRRLALTDLQHALKAAVPVVTGQDAGSPLLLAYCYIISQDKQLIVIDKSKAFDALSFFGPSSIDNLSEDLFKQVCDLKLLVLISISPLFP